MLKNGYNLAIFSLVALNSFFLYLNFGSAASSSALYFLDVGQGDSILFVARDGMKILTDAGPTSKIEQSLGNVLGNDHYFDLGIITHQQLDHFNGFNFLFKTRSFGALLFNGRTDRDIREWKLLVAAAKENNIPMIPVGAGDRIKSNDAVIQIISPNSNFVQSGEWNDTGIVELVKTTDFSALLTADIGLNLEAAIAKLNIKADILKVGHHGSKTSSGDVLLQAVEPKVAGIEVGEKNTYRHPTKEALDRIGKYTSYIYRTDQNGTIKITSNGRKLQIFTEK